MHVKPCRRRLTYNLRYTYGTKYGSSVHGTHHASCARQQRVVYCSTHSHTEVRAGERESAPSPFPSTSTEHARAMGPHRNTACVSCVSRDTTPERRESRDESGWRERQREAPVSRACSIQRPRTLSHTVTLCRASSLLNTPHKEHAHSIIRPLITVLLRPRVVRWHTAPQTRPPRRRWVGPCTRA